MYSGLCLVVAAMATLAAGRPIADRLGGVPQAAEVARAGYSSGWS
jgi:hypothetical protein